MTIKPAAQATFQPAHPWPAGAPGISAALQRYLVPLALLFFCGWLIFNVFATVERILHYYNALPYWDYWQIAEHLRHYQAFDLRVLWKQHNDHRIIFPEIIFAVDMLVLHGRMILPLAASFLCYVTTWLLLSSTLFSDHKLNRPIAITAALLAGIMAFWQGSAVVLAAPFQLQWTLMQLSVSCSLVWLSRLKESRRTVYLIGTIAAAVVANYSSGNGLLLWPILLALGIAVGLDRQRMLILTIASFIFGGLYFVEYQFGSDLNIRNLLLHPGYLLAYLASYLSMPFGGMKSPEFGVSIGLANLLTTVLLFVTALRRRWVNSQPGLVLFSSYGFTLLTILLTAAGRMDPAEGTFSSAKASRYITVPLMNWAVFILLCFCIAAKSRFRIVLSPVLACILGVLLLLYLPKLRDWLALFTEEYAEEQMAALSMQNDVFDPNLLRKVFISPAFVMQYVPELRTQHLSIYYKARDRWLGKPVTQFSSVSNTTIPGQITGAFPVRGGVEITGWADLSRLRRAYTWIVFSNEEGRIVGFGKRLAAGFPAILVSDNAPPSLGWVGFVNLSTPSKSVSAYAVDSRRGGLFPISGSMPVPALQPGSLEETTGQIPAITWQRDPAWKELTVAPRVIVGDAPPGVSYGSWSGSDANQGQIVSSTFAAPTNACLIMPVLHGPKSGGLSVELQDVDTGNIVARAPIQDGDTRWEYWRIPISSSVHHLREVAADNGTFWGEWLGVATPLTCR